jgi:hypothetical protein
MGATRGLKGEWKFGNPRCGRSRLADKIAEMTICKLSHQFCRSLDNVRQESLVKEEVVKHWH